MDTDTLQFDIDIGTDTRQIQCGRACVAAMLSLAGVPYSNSELESCLPTDEAGTVSAAQIVTYLQSKGVTVQAMQVGPTSLLNQHKPAILYEERPHFEGAVKQLNPHFVAVVGYRDRELCLFNPDTSSPRTGWISADYALQYWSGLALFVDITPENTSPAQTPLSPDEGVSALWVAQWILLPLLPWVCVLYFLRKRAIGGSTSRDREGAVSSSLPRLRGGGPGRGSSPSAPGSAGVSDFFDSQ